MRSRIDSGHVGVIRELDLAGSLRRPQRFGRRAGADVSHGGEDRDDDHAHVIILADAEVMHRFAPWMTLQTVQLLPPLLSPLVRGRSLMKESIFYAGCAKCTASI